MSSSEETKSTIESEFLNFVSGGNDLKLKELLQQDLVTVGMMRKVNLLQLINDKQIHLLKLFLIDHYIPNAININDINSLGNTLLMEAVIRNDANLVKLLKDYPHDTVEINIQNFIGDTALTLACFKGYLSIVEVLLQFPSINLNIQNKQGFSALHIAVYCDWEEIVYKLLLTEKANPNNKREDGNNCYDDTVNQNVLAMIQKAGGVSTHKKILCIVM